MPMAIFSAGMCSSISFMEMALPKWNMAAPVSRMESIIWMAALPQL